LGEQEKVTGRRAAPGIQNRPSPQATPLPNVEGRRDQRPRWFSNFKGLLRAGGVRAPRSQ